MKLKQIALYSIGTIVALVALYWVLATEIPAVKSRVIVFTFWLAAEVYLWLTAQHAFSLFSAFRKKTTARKIGELAITFLYWLPFIVVALYMLVLAQNGVKNIDKTFYLTVIGFSAIQYVIKFAITGLLVAWQIVLKIVKIKRNTLNIPRLTRRFLRVSVAFYAVAIVLMLWGTLWGATNLTVKNTTIETGKECLQENPLKIVHISDLHLSTWRNPYHVAKALDIIAAQYPDMIMITGDIVQFEGSEIDPYLPLLEEMSAPLGIYSVLGNHDYGRYARFKSEEARIENVQQLIEKQRALGWKVLCNENISLSYDSSFITIIGTGHWSQDDMFINDADLPKAMRGVNAENVNILLSHNPQIWKREVLPNYPVDLTLSGHTHGMQLGIYRDNFRFSPAALLYKEWGGLYEEALHPDKRLYVNVGLGSVGFPIRVGVYPEITVIELR